MIEYLKLIRIPNWFKNVFVFVPLVFSKHLFEVSYLQNAIYSFLVFSLASSFVYIINDIFDAERDSIHPIKKNRPIAKGTIKKKNALIFAVIILSLVIALLILQVNVLFILIITTYMIINFFYSLILKNLVIVDIISIAIGFMLRVIGGAIIISVHISNWLILTTLFLSLFLAVMKRRAELSLLNNMNEQRTVLNEYSFNFIDQISAVTSAGVIFSYALYTVSDRTIIMFGSEYFVITTIFVVFGIFRYMYLVMKKNIGENIVDAIFNDVPMIINLILYLVTSILIIYNNIYD